MKKLFLFTFLLMFLLLFHSVYVKCIEGLQLPNQYIEQGVGNDSYLLEEDYEIVSGFVNWDKEGSYIVTYKDLFDNIYTKNYVIIPKKDNQYFITKNEEQEIKVDSNKIVIDIFYLNDSSFYVISNYQMLDPTAPDQEKINVTYYEDYKYKWEYNYYKYSRYVSGYLYNDNIVITGLVYNENNNYINSIVLFEITKNREIIKSREIKSNESCFVYDIYIDNGYVYLITVTNGNQFDYEKYKEDTTSRIVIMKLLYKTFQIENAVTNTDVVDFFVIDTSYYDRRLTINVLLKEKIGIYTNCIYEYNDQLEFINKFYFSITNKDYIGHQVTGSEVCFFSVDHSIDSNCVKIEYLNMGVDNKNILLDLYNIHYINSLEVVHVNGNDVYFVLKNKSNKETNFLGYCKINSHIGVTYYTLSPENIDIIKSKICNGILINFYKKENKLFSKLINILEIKTLEFENNLVKNKNKKLYLNFNELNKYQFIITSNKNIFGCYKNVYQFTDFNNNNYFLEDEETIKFHCNVIDNETYQQNYKLEFNGYGILNGEEIDNNYKVIDIGKYQLVIKGNDESKIITFSISDLTVNPIKRNQMDCYIKTIEVKEENTYDEQYILNTYEFIMKDRSKHVIPLSIAILCFGIVCFLFMRKKI